MSDDRNAQPGAPSDDTTSALFVSARKKQLEQQETDRRAKEKENQRLAAEAEVQRLELEVEERRRKAQEDKMIAEAEAVRIAHEAQAKKAMAQTNPNAVLGSQQYAANPAQKAPKAHGMPNATAPSATGTPAPGLLKNKKMLMIIGGAAAVVVIAVVLIIVLSSSGGGVKIDPNMVLGWYYSDYGISLNYPEGWSVFTEEYPPRVYVQSDYSLDNLCDTVMFKDVTWEYMDFIYDDIDPIFAGVLILDDSIEEFSGYGTYDEFSPDSLVETWDGWLSGGTSLSSTTAGGDTIRLYMDFVPSNDGLLLTVIALPERKRGFDDALALCMRIAATAELYYSPSYDDQTYSEPQVYRDLNSGIFFEHPDGWYVAQASGASTFYVPVVIRPYSDSFDRMIVYNYTPEFNAFIQDGNSGMDNLLDDFAYRFIEDAGYDYYDMYNVEFSDTISNGRQEMILLQMEDDEAYFCFYIIKFLSDPQQVAAVVLETRSIDAREDFGLVINTLELE